MARPVKYTQEVLAKLNDSLNKYINETDIPILKEFCYLNDIPSKEVYEHEELTYFRKKLIDKKEAQLERLGLNGKVDKTMAIFSLKQLGWSDKKEIEHSVAITEFNILPPK